MLDGTNYCRWQQEAYLQTQEFWEVMTNDFPISAEPQGRTTGTGAAAVTIPPMQVAMDEYHKEIREWVWK
jgi:hypothetical protein